VRNLGAEVAMPCEYPSNRSTSEEPHLGARPPPTPVQSQKASLEVTAEFALSAEAPSEAEGEAEGSVRPARSKAARFLVLMNFRRVAKMEQFGRNGSATLQP
jgi:hypothetical protein